MLNNKYFILAVALIATILVSLLLLGFKTMSGPSSIQTNISSPPSKSGIYIPLDKFKEGEFILYKSDQLGLELHVPTGFKVDDYALTQYNIPSFSFTPTALENANMNVTIQRYKKTTAFGIKDPQNALDSEIDLYKKAGLSYIGGSMTINGLSAYTMSTEQMGTRDTIVYIVNDEDVAYLQLFELKPDDRHLALFGKILDSVKITEKKDVQNKLRPSSNATTSDTVTKIKNDER